jgi:ABC-type oligopeptide transport system ATPase subunit
LELVALPKDCKDRFPREFSGGQRQRIAIARALALNPDFLICDEALSALDASTQLQIIHLLQRLQKELGLTYLFIAHDLGMVRMVSNRIAVMNHGEIVEMGAAEEVFSHPRHPFTKLLLSSQIADFSEKAKPRNEFFKMPTTAFKSSDFEMNRST